MNPDVFQLLVLIVTLVLTIAGILAAILLKRQGNSKASKAVVRCIVYLFLACFFLTVVVPLIPYRVL